jgi:hypothetical protein
MSAIDFEDVGAKITEQHGAIRAGQRLRHFNDANGIKDGFHGRDYS